jgi:hypothetical protein
MANAAFIPALAAMLALAHMPGCSPAPAADEAATAVPSQTTDAITPAEPAGSTADPVASPASVGDADITFADPSLIFAATFPAAPADDPVVVDLREDAERYLVSLKAKARADFDRAKKAGQTPRPWDVRVRWRYTAKAGDIVSLIGELSEYTGGAHPNMRFETRIARASGAGIAFNDMLVAQRSPSPAAVIAICEALKAAKIEKIKSATILDEPIVCVGASANAKTEAARIALAPSSEPSKFGGVYAYYEPYAVGAYAEGPYVLTIQQEIFAEDLRPEFKPLFGGEAPAPKN